MKSENLDGMRIVYGRSGKRFAERVCEKLREYPSMEDIVTSKTEVQVFSDGELKPKVKENLRKKDVYIVQRFHRIPHGINEDLMELILLNDAVKRASAKSITNILPYMPYSRQDKKVEGRVPISSKKIISILESDADRIITMDLHAQAIQGFSEIPIDNLEARALFTRLINERWDPEDAVLVSPDLGGAERIEDYSDALKMDRVTIRKKRTVDNKPETREIEGRDKVQGREAIVIDDMIDTGGTIKKSVEVLEKYGVEDIHVFTTHPLLSPPAPKSLSSVGIDVTGTDTVPHTEEFLENNKDWFDVHTVSKMFAEAIYKIQTGGSLSQSVLLFPYSN